MRRSRTLLLVALTAVSLTLADDAAGQPPAAWFGTWTLNLEKSTYIPGPPPYVRATYRVEPLGDGLRMVYDMVRVRGGVTHLEWTGRLDGEDYPVQGLDDVLTNSYRQLDDRTYETVVKVDGQVTATARVTFSPDGRTMTTETLGAGPQGQRLMWTTVYEKTP